MDTELITDYRKDHKHVDEVFSKAIKPSDVADAVIFALSTPPNVQVSIN